MEKPDPLVAPASQKMSRFSADVARYRSKSHRGKELWLHPALWAIACYRLGNWLYTARPFILVRIPLKVISYLANKWCEVFMEMCIDPQATIGPGLYIGHIGGVHINPQAVLGSNCDVAHRVTIGASAMGRQGCPVLGDDVYIGTGATLVGRIKIGNGAKISANTLVITNVPAGATVMGVPGRIIMRPPKPAAAPVLAAVETSDAQ
jgi:serine O-acetyltransferase